MSGRPPDPKKRERILSAAIALFLKDGYNDTTTADIARRARMSSSHMYIYFKDKEDLLVEAVRRMKEEHTALSTRLAKRSKGLGEEEFVALFYKAQATIRDRVRFIMDCILAPETAASFKGVDFDFSGVFLPFLKGWPEEQAARTAWALMAIAVGYFFGGEAEDAKAAALDVLRNAKAAISVCRCHRIPRIRTTAFKHEKI